MDSYIEAYSDYEKTYYLGYEVIVNATIDRIEKYLEENNIPYEINETVQIYEFLMPLVDAKVWVKFDCDFPTSNEYVYKSIQLKTHMMNLAYSVNSKEGKFPNELYVSVEEDNERRFKELWRKNYLPTIILNEAIGLLDLTKHIVIHVYETPGPLYNMLNVAKKPIIIGQQKDKNGQYKHYRPLGFVDGNTLVLTSPNERIEYGGMTFNFN